MEFGPMTCWDCPEPLKSLLFQMLVGTALVCAALALVQTRRRFAVWAGWLLFAAAVLFCLATAAIALRYGVDWRWARTDLDFVRRPRLVVVSLVLWWGAMLFLAVAVRRRFREAPR